MFNFKKGIRDDKAFEKRAEALGDLLAANYQMTSPTGDEAAYLEKVILLTKQIQAMHTKAGPLTGMPIPDKEASVVYKHPFSLMREQRLKAIFGENVFDFLEEPGSYFTSSRSGSLEEMKNALLNLRTISSFLDNLHLKEEAMYTRSQMQRWVDELMHEPSDEAEIKSVLGLEHIHPGRGLIVKSLGDVLLEADPKKRTLIPVELFGSWVVLVAEGGKSKGLKLDIIGFVEHVEHLSMLIDKHRLLSDMAVEINKRSIGYEIFKIYQSGLFCACVLEGFYYGEHALNAVRSLLRSEHRVEGHMMKQRVSLRFKDLIGAPSFDERGMGNIQIEQWLIMQLQVLAANEGRSTKYNETEILALSKLIQTLNNSARLMYRLLNPEIYNLIVDELQYSLARVNSSHSLKECVEVHGWGVFDVLRVVKDMGGRFFLDVMTIIELTSLLRFLSSITVALWGTGFDALILQSFMGYSQDGVVLAASGWYRVFSKPESEITLADLGYCIQDTQPYGLDEFKNRIRKKLSEIDPFIFLKQRFSKNIIRVHQEILSRYAGAYIGADKKVLIDELELTTRGMLQQQLPKYLRPVAKFTPEEMFYINETKRDQKEVLKHLLTRKERIAKVQELIDAKTFSAEVLEALIAYFNEIESQYLESILQVSHWDASARSVEQEEKVSLMQIGLSLWESRHSDFYRDLQEQTGIAQDHLQQILRINLINEREFLFAEFGMDLSESQWLTDIAGIGMHMDQLMKNLVHHVLGIDLKESALRASPKKEDYGAAASASIPFASHALAEDRIKSKKDFLQASSKAPVEIYEGYILCEARGDGNCLFHAVADQLKYHGIKDETNAFYTHETLRAMVVARARANPELAKFFEEGELDKLAELGTWGNEQAIRAMSDIFKLQFQILRSDGHKNHILGEASAQVIRLRFNGGHYDSLRPMPVEAKAVLGALQK